MAVDTISPYKRFQQILLPDPKIDRAMYDRVQTDPNLKAASLEYQRVLRDGDFKTIHDTVLNLASQLAKDETLASYNIRPEDVQVDFEKQAGPLSTPEKPQQESQQPQPESRNVSERQAAPPINGGVTADMITSEVHSLQAEDLMRQFDDALERGGSRAIQELLKNVDTQKLLSQQVEIAKAHLNMLDAPELELGHLDDAKKAQLREQFEKIAIKKQEMLAKDQKKILGPKEQEAKQKRETEDTGWQNETLNESLSPDARRAAFRKLAQSRIAQTQAYSIFVEFYLPEQELEFANLLPIFRQIQRTRQELAARKEQTLENLMRSQATGNPIRNIPISRGRPNKNKVDQLVNSPLGKLAEKAGPEAKLAIEAIRHRKALQRLAIILILFGLAIFVAFVGAIVAIILAIVSLLTQNGGTAPVNAGPGVQQVIQLTNRVLTCETSISQPGRNYVYNYSQPSIGCLQVLVNTASSDNEKRALVNIRGARKPLQCGVFIESALMAAGWKLFPPSVPTVISWFLNFFNHTFDGYTFIFNNGQTSGNDAIEPGDIIIYGPGSPGHISFVTELITDQQGKPDHFHIKVAEANFKAGVAWFRETTIAHRIGSNRILGWWRKTQ